MTRVLVCGGRDFTNYKQLCRVLDALHRDKPFSLLIQGGARGADTLAKNWAEERGVPYRQFNAKWIKYKRAAGPIRNKQMIQEGKPDYVVAFPGAVGTADMIKQAIRFNIKVIEVEIDEA